MSILEKIYEGKKDSLTPEGWCCTFPFEISRLNTFLSSMGMASAIWKGFEIPSERRRTGVSRWLGCWWLSMPPVYFFQRNRILRWCKTKTLFCCPQETSRKEGRRGKVNVFLDFLTVNWNQFLLFMIFLTVAFFSK